jgi:transposase
VGVIIGMDPHKRSATIEIVDERAEVLVTCRFGTDKASYAQMLAMGRKFADRIWAVEGCNGIGKHIAHRLVHDGEIVLDVPSKLSAQVRVFVTGNGRKTDSVDAHSVAMAALRAPGLVRVQVDDDLVVMGMLADRRDELSRARTQTVNRLHRLLLELFPGGAKRFLSAQQARALIATIRPQDLAGQTRRRLAKELIGELKAIDKKIKCVHRELTGLVTARGSTLLELPGIGPLQCRPPARRRRRHSPLRRPRQVRVLERHRTAGCLFWQPGTAPAIAGRQPADQPGAAHHGRCPAAQPDPGPGLLRRAQGRRNAIDDGHAGPQATTVQRGLRPDARRPETTRSSGSGWAIGGRLSTPA